MILACPSCGARFKIDAAKLQPNGRTVRCAKCRHTWRAEPESEPAEPAGAAESDPEAAAPQAAESETARAEATAGDSAAPQSDGGAGDPEAEAGVRAFESSLRANRTSADAAPADVPGDGRRRNTGVIVGWVLLVLVILGAVAGLHRFRDQVVAQVPQAAQLYRMAGIEVPAVGAGLELRDVTRTRRLVDGESLLVIEGRVVNTGERETPVPPLRVALFDAAGDEVLAWTVRVGESRLPAGGETRFSTRRENPPETAREFALTFAPTPE